MDLGTEESGSRGRAKAPYSRAIMVHRLLGFVNLRLYLEGIGPIQAKIESNIRSYQILRKASPFPQSENCSVSKREKIHVRFRSTHSS